MIRTSKKALFRTPTVRTGKARKACINEAGFHLLGGNGYIALVKSDNGEISLRRVEVPDGIVNVIKLWKQEKKWKGGNNFSRGNMLEDEMKYMCRWDDYNEKLVIVEGIKEVEHSNLYDSPHS